MRDPYEVLEVSSDASQADIRAAYRRLAAQHHPDRNPGDESATARFQELNAAYQILGDERRRALFDEYGSRAAGAPPGDFVDLGSMGLDGLFGEILGAFGIRTGDRGDLRKQVRLTFEEAALGCEKEVTYTRLDTCEHCSGSGAEPGTRLDVCPACSGRGRVRFQQGLLPLPVERNCSRCRGTGRVPTTACHACRGHGLSEQLRTLAVSFPAGIEEGASRLVEEAGHRTRPDRPPGDLELVVEIEEHPVFRRQGSNVICTVSVSLTKAALGGELEVPSLRGRVKVRVPPATQHGTVLRVRGRGIPHRYRSGRGDQLVEIGVEVPTRLTQRARDLIEELHRELDDEEQPPQTFLHKLKSLFE